MTAGRHWARPLTASHRTGFTSLQLQAAAQRALQGGPRDQRQGDGPPPRTPLLGTMGAEGLGKEERDRGEEEPGGPQEGAQAVQAAAPRLQAQGGSSSPQTQAPLSINLLWH